MSDNESNLALITAWRDNIAHEIELVRRDIQKAGEVNYGRTEAAFKRIDELNAKFFELSKEDERIKATFVEKIYALEKEMNEKFAAQRETNARNGVYIALASIIGSAVVLGVINFLVTKVFPSSHGG